MFGAGSASRRAVLAQPAEIVRLSTAHWRVPLVVLGRAGRVRLPALVLDRAFGQVRVRLVLRAHAPALVVPVCSP